MRSLEGYFEEYAKSHKNGSNLLIHKICVPLITWSLLGFLHTFQLAGVPLSYVLVFVSLCFYAALKRPMVFVFMFFITFFMLSTFAYIPHLRILSLIVFALAWVGQFIGHHIEGKKPSFLDDLQFLLIGPLWVLFHFPILRKILSK